MKMNNISTISSEEKYQHLVRAAFWLSIFTIFYNLIEGIVSTYFGLHDNTLVLFGFGLDSYVEVLSAMGITHMIIRMKKQPNVHKDTFEITALRINGISFYLLTAFLSIGAIVNIYQMKKPETTFWGIVISLISIISMAILMQLKLMVGRKMDSDPIIADANCTKTCLYMSIILLVSSVIYELTGLFLIDSLGAIALAYFSYNEGKESMEKASKKDYECSC